MLIVPNSFVRHACEISLCTLKTEKLKFKQVGVTAQSSWAGKPQSKDSECSDPEVRSSHWDGIGQGKLCKGMRVLDGGEGWQAGPQDWLKERRENSGKYRHEMLATERTETFQI